MLHFTDELYNVDSSTKQKILQSFFSDINLNKMKHDSMKEDSLLMLSMRNLGINYPSRLPHIERLRLHQSQIYYLLSSPVKRSNEFAKEACCPLIVNSIGRGNRFATDERLWSHLRRAPKHVPSEMAFGGQNCKEKEGGGWDMLSMDLEVLPPRRRISMAWFFFSLPFYR